MTRLLVALVASSLVVLACGSGGDQPQPGGTATSERAERSASVSEQEAADQEDPAVADEEAAEDSDVAQQVEAQEEDSDAQVDALPVDVVGVHKGIRSQRNVLGEPDAAVEIMYFGDFT